MKSVINYYYNLYPNDIFYKDNEYYFFINNVRYSFAVCYDAEEVYKTYLYMLNQNLYVHPVILNKDGSSYTMVNSKPFVLMKMVYYVDRVNINSIISFSSFPIGEMDFSLHHLWSKKNDYMEYQINLIGDKYKLIKSSIDYYIGLGENAIELINVSEVGSIPLYYAHKRVGRSCDLYNPLNICLDTRVRDIAEYLKDKFFSGEDISNDLDYFFSYIHLSEAEYIVFLARMFYPTYYYDLTEKIIKKELDEDQVISIIDKSSDYEMIIKKIYNYYKSFINIPIIDWLE